MEARIIFVPLAATYATGTWGEVGKSIYILQRSIVAGFAAGRLGTAALFVML